MWKTAIQPLISLMKLSLPIMFLVWQFFSGKTSLLQNVCPEDKVFLQVRSGIYSCRNIQYVERCSAIRLFHEVQPPSRFFAWYLLFKGKASLVQNNDAHFVQIFHSYNMEGHIAHIQPWRVFFFCDTFFTAIGQRGVVSSRFGEEISKTGRVAIGVVGGAQG